MGGFLMSVNQLFAYHCTRILGKRIVILALCLKVLTAGYGQQPRFSLATDLAVQHSFKQEQRYTAIGQTVNLHFSFTAKEGAYFGFSYYSFGKFTNSPTATAKSVVTLPQQINYTNYGSMRYKCMSIGWKHYIKGSFDIDQSWNLYGYAGFGLMLGSLENTHSVVIDTTDYYVPVKSGTANFKRLTLDLALGWEVPLGGYVYLYSEARVWIPTTDYPSQFLFVNKNAPLMGALNLGVRILF
jgi:hypothetical protein